MRWNTEAGECQIYMDVDCSDITYDTPPSPTILEAVEKAKQRLNATEACPQPKFLCEDATTCLGEAQVCNGVSDCPQWETGPGGEDEECLDGSGEQPQEIQQGDPSASPPAPTGSPQPHNQLAPRRQLTNSLLTQIDTKTSSKDELREALCRDVDAFSFEFAQTPASPPPARVAPVPDEGSGEQPQEAQQGDPSASTPAPTGIPPPHNQLAPRRQLTNSLLTQIDPKTTSKDELREAFCRDVDAFSFEFAQTPASP